MADEAGEEDISDLDLPESSSGKRKPRSTKAILREKIAAELERLQAVDTTYLTAAKRGSIHKKIKQAQDKLTKVVEGAKKPDSMKRTTTSSGEGEKGKTQYSDDDTVRLIYARTYLDHEFNQHVNNRDGKWAMIQNIYNAGFIFPMSKLSPQPPEDVRFDPLSPDKHKTDDSLARKWEKLTSILRQIVVSKTEVHIQMKVHEKSLQGPKRDMAVLHAEVLKEANDAREKFKFYKVMESCGWVARIDPGERVNVAAFERAETVSATGPLPQGEAAEPAPVSAPPPPASPTSAASATTTSTPPSTSTTSPRSDGSRKVDGRLGGGRFRSHHISQEMMKGTRHHCLIHRNISRPGR